MANFTNNTTQLQNLLEKVNALPEAGSGDFGGGSVETCTVTIFTDDSEFGMPKNYAYTAIDENGEILPYYIANNSTMNVTLTDVLCNSIMIVRPRYNAFVTFRGVGANRLNTEDINDSLFIFKITAPAGGNATIEFYQGGGGSND